MFDPDALFRPLISLGGLALFLMLELTVPYRESSVSKTARWFDNLGLTLFNNLILFLIFGSAVAATAYHVTEHRIGVLNLIPLPYWIKVTVTVVFMDFMLYVWHLLNHEMPMLWRFHRVHHTDLNMDVSTATRFHLGELTISAGIKIGLVYFLGADFTAVIVFETLLVLCAQFHHSSLKVPEWFERIYWILFVPPSMHRIHHSVVIKERNTNYGTIFSLWDRMLETLLKDVPQERIRIGVGAYPRFEKVRLRDLLLMPFTRAVK